MMLRLLALFFVLGWMRRKPVLPAVPAPAPPLKIFDPLPAAPDQDDPTVCPICGWSPCREDCRLGLSQYDVERMSAEFRSDWSDEEGDNAAA